MFSALKKLFTRKDTGSEGSKVKAKSRLQFVLVQDRVGLSNEDLSSFRKELLEVIEKYFIVNEKDFAINYKRDADATRLSINSPVVVRREFKQEKEEAPKSDTIENKPEAKDKVSNDVAKDKKQEFKANQLNIRKKKMQSSPNFKKKKKVANQ